MKTKPARASGENRVREYADPTPTLAGPDDSTSTAAASPKSGAGRLLQRRTIWDAMIDWVEVAIVVMAFAVAACFIGAMVYEAGR